MAVTGYHKDGQERREELHSLSPGTGDCGGLPAGRLL